MHGKMRCVHCRCRLVPHPRARTQRCGANQACQRASKAPWQRNKLATDPAYRAHQRDCQHRWQRQPPQYGRAYRQQRAAYRARHRLLHQLRDDKRRAPPLAKMDVIEPVTCMHPGIDHRIPAVGEPLAKMDGVAQKCPVIPITEPCLQKRT